MSSTHNGVDCQRKACAGVGEEVSSASFAASAFKAFAGVLTLIEAGFEARLTLPGPPQRFNLDQPDTGRVRPLTASAMLNASHLLFALTLPLQQVEPQLPPSPIARLVVTPANPTMIAQDTLQLGARALDASGAPVPNVRYRFVQSSGARFEGRVDTTGLVRSGSTGTIPVTVIAMVPGTRPVTQVVEVRMLPGPAARIAIDAAPPRLVAGQQVILTGTVFSAAGDQRTDRLSWRSSAPNVARVSSDGRLTAVAAGRATITASAGQASATLPVTVVAGSIASLAISPTTVAARTGDVLRFTVTAKDASGKTIDGLTPTWTFSPGHGMIEQDGAFVGYEARPYTVMASIGNRVTQATVTLTHRDVRRPATVVGRLPRTRFRTEEVWLHPNGKYAYLGSGGGGDVMYTIDISDSGEAGRHRLDRREHAARQRHHDDGRRQVPRVHARGRRRPQERHRHLLDSRTPRTRSRSSEFTDGVTAGVHSIFIYKQEKFGTHVYPHRTTAPARCT